MAAVMTIQAFCAITQHKQFVPWRQPLTPKLRECSMPYLIGWNSSWSGAARIRQQTRLWCRVCSQTSVISALHSRLCSGLMCRSINFHTYSASEAEPVRVLHARACRSTDRAIQAIHIHCVNAFANVCLFTVSCYILVCNSYNIR